MHQAKQGDFVSPNCPTAVASPVSEGDGGVNLPPATCTVSQGPSLRFLSSGILNIVDEFSSMVLDTDEPERL